MQLDDPKWEAIVRCDPAFDGRFVYAVKTTGIACRPSCKSKTPQRANVEIFPHYAAAATRGYRPCKRCRPELATYQPDAELLSQVKILFERYYDDRDKLLCALKQLNISQNQLIRLFRRSFQMTPVELLNKLRLAKAVELLQNTDQNILEIALACGFGSLSAFYGCFKKRLGISPGAVRNRGSRSRR